MQTDFSDVGQTKMVKCFMTCVSITTTSWGWPQCPSTFQSMSVNLTELKLSLCFLKSVCCSGHLNSDLLQKQISCKTTSHDYFLGISLKSILWFARYFANRQMSSHGLWQTFTKWSCAILLAFKIHIGGISLSYYHAQTCVDICKIDKIIAIFYI